jgi:hypothetical protein
VTEGDARNVVSGITEVSSKLIGSLPAQFLVLCLLNALFLGGVLWFLDRENSIQAQTEAHGIDVRERLLTPILTACFTNPGKEKP